MIFPKIMYICHFSRRLRKEYSTINSKAMDTDKKDPSVPVEQVNAPGIEDMLNPPRHPPRSPMKNNRPKIRRRALKPETKKRPDAAAAEQQPEAAEPGDTQTDADTSAERVDFSDEDAALAASAPEFDLGEASEEESADLKKESGDYTGKTKEELLSAFETLLSTQPVQIIRNDAEAIKVAFTKYTGARRNSCAGSSSSRAA